MRLGFWRLWLIGAAVGALGLWGAGGALAARVHGAAARQQARNALVTSENETTTNGDRGDDSDLADQQAQYGYERTAPAEAVSGPALLSASQQAASLPTQGSSWQEFTTAPFNAQPSNYTDPFWSNAGAGFSLVGGRATALAQTPDGAWFAGTADGGVWRSRDQGRHWTPLFDAMPTLSIGALAVDPTDGSLWVGTGEANLSQDSYAGTGVYRSTNDGASFRPVGANSAGTGPLASHTIFDLAFDPEDNVYAPTDNGLFRLANGSNQWTEVLDPAGPTDFPPYDQQVTSVAVVPGTHGHRHPTTVIAAIGWHGPGQHAVQRLLPVHRRRTFVHASDPDGRRECRRHRSNDLCLLGRRQEAVCDRAVGGGAWGGRRFGTPGHLRVDRQPGQRDRTLDQDRRRHEAVQLRLG
jgi:hypothetical protein